LPKPYLHIQIAFNALALEANDMKHLLPFFAAFAAFAINATPAFAIAPKADQQLARKQMGDGNLSLRQIEARVLPKMRGMEYLGPEYFEDTRVYRLKFIDNGRVIFVDVDARNGSILRQR
jgi:hypothetical protein